MLLKLFGSSNLDASVFFLQLRAGGYLKNKAFHTKKTNYDDYLSPNCLQM